MPYRQGSNPIVIYRCEKSYLSVKNQTALPALRNRKSFQERYNKNVIQDRITNTTIQSNHYLYTERTTMYVMADLSRRDEPTTIESTDSETLLCTVTYDKVRKLLTISPDFTLGDEQHYNVTNDYGVRFNYRIEHISEERTPLELQEHLEDVRREVQQQLSYKETELYKELQLPPANLSALVISLDIVSARNFSYDGLFVTYFIDLPQHWSTNQKERLVGRTQKSLLDNKTAHFSYCTDICLYYPSNEVQSLSNNASSRWPRLLFSVASLDSWTRYRMEGYAALPIPMTPDRYKFTIPTWRAKGSIIDTLRRFFVGGSYELEDITFCGIPISHEDRVLDKSNLKIVPISTDTLINNVENVLEQFQAAKERMIRIRTINS
ncbi:Meckel syndrome type 1 protein [Cyphomyrmex costatus]|uniref:Meckel syndrome type 1 protein n=1 Tax=Cyphomyrmex costatus TaxID=456900 RepID=A0A151ID34_9HYME|nr:Meckel syndrome type 1 protein [Cyphomyrmex costatus]